MFTLGQAMIVHKAVYGLKSSGAAFRAHLAASLTAMNFENTRADPDVWRRKARKPSGQAYWELVFVYVDDLLCMSHNPKDFMNALSDEYTLKKESVKEPDICLGAEISKFMFKDGSSAWSMSSTKYLKATIENVKGILTKDGRKLCVTKRTANVPFPTSIVPSWMIHHI